MKEMYFTHSLNLVAYLMNEGLELQGIHKQSGKNATFYFERSQKLKDLINQYNQDFKLKNFLSNYKKIKEMLKI